MANRPTYSPEAHKREQTFQKPKSVKTAYRYEQDDIVILSGEYDGKKITEIWKNGSADDRDFLFREFWKKDPIAKEILAKCCGR